MPDVLELVAKPEQSLTSVEDISRYIGGMLALSADWPDGLHLLLRNYPGGFSVGKYAQNALQCAVDWRNHECVDILFAAGAKITYLLWKEAVRLYNSEVVQDVIDLIAEELFQSRSQDFKLETLFHPYDLSVDTAMRLYRAGFHEVDVEIDANDIGGADGLCTPLWRHSKAILSCWRSRTKNLEMIKLLRWFVEKGARTDYLHQTVGTAPAHLISATLMFYCFLREPIPLLLRQENLDDFYATVFGFNCRDRCNCACSQRGCYPIASAVKIRAWKKHIRGLSERIWRYDHFDRYVTYGSLEQVEVAWPPILSEIVAFMKPALSQRPQLALAVLRVLTFEELGIRHTCHDAALAREPWSRHPPPVIPEEEITELHDEDRFLIAQLEDLMIKFEQAWTQHEGAFHDFVFGYWNDRMEEVLDKMEAAGEEEIRAIEAIGVVLREPFGPVLPPGFEREVDEDEEEEEQWTEDEGEERDEDEQDEADEQDENGIGDGDVVEESDADGAEESEEEGSYVSACSSLVDLLLAGD